MTEQSEPFALPTGGYDETVTRRIFNRIMKQDGVRRTSAVAWASSDLCVWSSTPAAMSVIVGVGGSFVQGAGHDNTTIKTLTIEAAHATYERTDSVVVRLSVVSPNSAVTLAVLKGDYAGVGASVAKALTQTSTTYELRLATVKVSPAVTSIVGTTDITDTRLTSECGMAAPEMGFFSIDPATGNMVSEGKEITGLAAPTVGTAAANKTYVDAVGAEIGDIAYSCITKNSSYWLPFTATPISRTTYSALFAAIGTTYGAGNGTTTFGIPIPGDAPVSYKAGDAAFGALGHVAISEQTHALSEAELAAHHHHAQSFVGGSGGATTQLMPAATTTTLTELTATTDTGSGAAHNNIQPSTVFKGFIRYA